MQPPTADLEDTDLAAARWHNQPGIDWIMLIPSLARAHTATVIKPVEPAQPVPFTLQWSSRRAQAAAVARFVQMTLTAELPPGWLTQPGHLRHQTGATGVEILRTEDVQQAGAGRPGRHDQARSNRSRFITLSHAATKSFTNFSFASSLA